MNEYDNRGGQRRGSSPAPPIPDRERDVWGERRLRLITKTPEDVFACSALTQRVDTGT